MASAIPRLISLILLSMALADSLQATAHGSAIHPQDGPHADLKFDLRSDAFVADISMNLVFLDFVMDSGREQPDKLEPSELSALHDRLQLRMAEVCRVRMNDQLVTPTLEALAMNEPDESLLPLFPQSGWRGLRKIKFTLRWPLAAIDAPNPAVPKSVSIVWQAYPPDELSTIEPQPLLILAAELTAEGVRSQLEFSQTEPEFTWRSTPGGMRARLLSVPEVAARTARTASLPSVACALVAAIAYVRALRAPSRGRRSRSSWTVVVSGAALAIAFAWFAPWMRVAVPGGGAAANLPSSGDALDIFRPLHANLYRAFDFTDESAIYDALAVSVDGPLLEDLYLTIHRSLVVHEEGGAMSRVRAVREIETQVDSVGLVRPDGGAADAPGFVVACRYQVDGRVTHWGHSHDRTNEYRARYTVLAGPNGWRIAEAEVLEQSRVDGDSPPPSESPKKDSPDGAFDS